MEFWKGSFFKNFKKKNINSIDLALLYSTHHKSIKTVIPGMMTIKEINQNLKFLKEKNSQKKN